MAELARFNSCLNCYYEQIEHFKAASETCKECFAKDTPARRYPNWKGIENGKTDTTT